MPTPESQVRAADSGQVAEPQPSAEGLAPRLLFTGVVASICVALIFGLQLGRLGFVSQAFAGGAVIYLLARRPWREWLVVGAAALALWCIYWFSGAKVDPGRGGQVCLPATFFGIASLVMLAWRIASAPISDRGRFLAILGDVTLLPGVCLVSAIAVEAAIRLSPLTRDSLLYAFDRALGFDASFATGRFFFAHWTSSLVCGFIYTCLPITMGLVIGLQSRRRLPGSVDVRWAYVVLGAAGFLMYQLCPAAGPKYLAGDAFPYHPPSAASIVLAPVPIPSDVPRNAMPSLHVGWMLLVVYNCWRRSLATRVFALAALCFTVLATLGLGEHYLIDLIVVFPLTVAVQLGCQDLRGRLPWVAVCAGITVAWLVALRSGTLARTAQPLVLWTLILATIAVTAVIALRSSLRPAPRP